MKPLVSDAALKAAFITLGGVLIVAGEMLVGMPDILNPRLAALIVAIGGLLGGKDLFKREGDIAIKQLPLEWQERKTDPQ